MRTLVRLASMALTHSWQRTSYLNLMGGGAGKAGCLDKRRARQRGQSLHWRHIMWLIVQHVRLNGSASQTSPT